ncbi:hypothetical protein [Porphyromonas vaginalis]|uniref:hypothetical protein n=1 Tax=Porphyromonas vaginalis TaxID=3044325 RepID=UPI00260DC346|nr:hypothetical protein [Porphyromonas vaginalis]
MLEYSTRITSQEPVTEDMRRGLTRALGDAYACLQQTTSLQQGLESANSRIDNSSQYAIGLINETQSQLCNLQVLGMSDSGVIEVKRQASCVRYDIPTRGRVYTPQTQPKPTYTKEQIPLTLRSTHNALRKHVNIISERLAQLEAATRITPITNTDLRQRGSTLYPRYGDWILTSDASDQYISFSGLSAEIGRSIYIQTRRKAYLYANSHSFFGLSAAGNGLSSNQWLESKTTYRFVRKDATTWLVTSSSSPYPWV